MTLLDDLPAGPQLRPERMAADKAVLGAAVCKAAVGGLPAPAPARRLRIGPVSLRLSVAGAVLGGVVAGGAAAAAVVALTPTRPTVFDEVRCYSEPSTDFGASFPGTTLTIAQQVGATGPVDVPDQARSACGAVWREGLLVAGATGIVPSGGTGDNPVPPLAVCVLPSGEAAVFPGEDGTCGHLGLPLMAPAGAGASRTTGKGMLKWSDRRGVEQSGSSSGS